MMPTLIGTTFSGFVRPSDPLVSSDLATKISADIGKTVSVIVTPTDVQVTGNTLVSGDATAIQASLSGYFYGGLEYGVGLYADADTGMTANSNSRVATQKAVSDGLKVVNRKAWVSGSLKTGSFIYASKATTTSGVVTFYLTDDGTSTGNAVFSTIYPDTIAVVVYGSAANYQPFGPVVAGDNKSITMSVNQVTSVLLGVIQLVSAANGVDCRLYVMGG